MLLLQQYTPQQQLFADPVSECHTALLWQAGTEGVIPHFWWGCGFVAEPSERLHMPLPSSSICCFTASAVFTGGLSHVHCRAAAVCQPLHSLQDELKILSTSVRCEAAAVQCNTGLTLLRGCTLRLTAACSRRTSCQ